jgi:hypothetical protein
MLLKMSARVFAAKLPDRGLPQNRAPDEGLWTLTGFSG